MKEQHFGEDHFEVAITLFSLGNAFGKLGDHNMKKNLLERALEIEEQHYGRDHLEVAETLFFLALVHGALGDRGNEARFFLKVLPIFERHFGMHHEYRGLVEKALNEAAEQLTEADQQNPEPCVVCFIFLSSFLAASVRLQRRVACVLVALGALSFPSRDGSTGSSIKAPRVLEMSLMCCPRASSSMRPDGQCFWSSLSLSLRSVYPGSRNRRTAPHASRSVPEDKCGNDVSFEDGSVQRSLGCSGLQWQFVGVVFG